MILITNVCVCVIIPFFLDVRLVDVPAGVTQEEGHRSYPPSFCGACLNFYCEKDSAVSFPRQPWSRILCTNELIVLHLLRFFFFFFLLRKNPSSCDCTEIRTHVPTSEGFEGTN